MKALNKQTAPKSVAPERIIQFGEGNFLRAFVDWIVYNMNQKTDFNSSVVVVQPIEKGMAEWLNGQDCLYHVNLQGRLNGEAVNSLTRIDCISRALNPYSQNSAFMALADQPEIRFVISNTTEAGIAFDPNCKFSDAPASSYPGKLTQLLYRRFKTFKGDKSKGLIIMPCELIFLNGHHLKECIYQYIELWKEDFGADYEKFKTWFTKYCYVCATLVDRIVPGFPRKEIAQIQKKICYADNLVVQAEIFHLWVIEAPQEIAKENQQYRLCLQYEYIGSNEMGNKIQKRDLEEFNKLLPMGYTAESDSNSWSWGEKDNRQYLLLLVVIAIIFFTTSVLFNSLKQPLAIIFVIPVSYIGVFLTFYWFRLNFDQGGFASFVLLCGITVNASIYVLNEYNSIRRRFPRLSALRAYVKAWNAKVVPIFLTVVSTILGFIPFMIGEDKEAFWFPLAAGTIGGLVMSVIGIFFFLPVFVLKQRDFLRK